MPTPTFHKLHEFPSTIFSWCLYRTSDAPVPGEDQTTGAVVVPNQDLRIETVTSLVQVDEKPVEKAPKVPELLEKTQKKNQLSKGKKGIKYIWGRFSRC